MNEFRKKLRKSMKEAKKRFEEEWKQISDDPIEFYSKQPAPHLVRVMPLEEKREKYTRWLKQLEERDKKIATEQGRPFFSSFDTAQARQYLLYLTYLLSTQEIDTSGMNEDDAEYILKTTVSVQQFI